MEKSELSIWDESESDNVQEITWSVNGKVYWAYFKQGQIRGIAIDPIIPVVSGKKVIECFGEPSHYSGYVTENELEDTIVGFALWYPENGLVAEYSLRDMAKSVDKPDIDGSQGMTLFFFEPGTIQNIQSRIAFAENLSNLYQYVEPWPGSWDKITIVD